MTEKEVTKRLEYLKHAFENDFSAQDRLRAFANERRQLSIEEQFKMYRDHPVCPKCMKIAFRDKGYTTAGWSTCPSCGWHGKTVTMDEVMHEKLYR